MPLSTRLLVLSLGLLSSACAEALDPVPSADPAAPSLLTRVVDDFDRFDPALWTAESHPLGRGSLDAANVSVTGGTAVLSLPASAYDGAEIRSVGTYRYGTFAARLQAPVAPGSLSAFFLYEGRPGSDNDEIDVEIYNDGSRRVLFTTWVAGRQTNTVEAVLPFDPAAGYHDYEIRWSASRVAFVVDGVAMHEFTRGVPRGAMHVYANAWWPVWLSGAPLAAPRPLLLDRVQIAS